MLDIEKWMARLTGELLERFGSRLLFLGLQGSYGRGEAGEDSDIDVVTVLDRVGRSDLDAYRAIVSAMPEGEKACGFLCGADGLKSWPRYDLYQLAGDTRAYHGELAPLLPALGRNDLADAAAIGASGLYHATCHTYLYGAQKDRSGFLKQAHKGSFFVLRALHELRTGDDVRTKRGLYPLLTGDEREILGCGLGEESLTLEEAFERLLRWSAAAMTEAQAQKDRCVLTGSRKEERYEERKRT